MSNPNKVTLSSQKIKNKNLGQNQVNLGDYLEKVYSFTNVEAKTLIDQAGQTNVIGSVLFNVKVVLNAAI